VNRIILLKEADERNMTAQVLDPILFLTSEAKVLGLVHPY
jgi:hypothetical protein